MSCLEPAGRMEVETFLVQTFGTVFSFSAVPSNPPTERAIRSGFYFLSLQVNLLLADLLLFFVLFGNHPDDAGAPRNCFLEIIRESKRKQKPYSFCVVYKRCVHILDCNRCRSPNIQMKKPKRPEKKLAKNLCFNFSLTQNKKRWNVHTSLLCVKGFFFAECSRGFCFSNVGLFGQCQGYRARPLTVTDLIFFLLQCSRFGFVYTSYIYFALYFAFFSMIA